MLNKIDIYQDNVNFYSLEPIHKMLIYYQQSFHTRQVNKKNLMYRVNKKQLMYRVNKNFVKNYRKGKFYSRTGS